MLDVMFYEVFEEEAVRLKALLPRSIKAGFTWKTVQEAPRRLPPASFISIRTQSIIPSEWGSLLSGILTRSAGYDHLLDYRQRVNKKIPGGYLPVYCGRAVAEQAILMMLALQRKLTIQLRQFAQFDRDGLTGCECLGKNMLVVGVGHIGREVVRLARGLNMNVRGVDLVRRERLTYVSLRPGLQWADVVVCALPLTEKTDGLLNYANLKLGRPTKIFINISRGEVSPTGDLLRLFREKRIAGVGVDVLAEEKSLSGFLRRRKKSRDQRLRQIQQLRKMDNCLLTPHNAFNTQEALERKARESVAAVVSFLRRKKFPSPIPSA